MLCYIPGRTKVICRTHLFIGKPDTEENRATFTSTIPLGRGSTPVDVANACCYLASDEAEFITGVDLQVSDPFPLSHLNHPQSFLSVTSREIGDHELIKSSGRWGAMCVVREVNVSGRTIAGCLMARMGWSHP